MDFAMDAFRICTVKALRGRTWAGDAVFDSPSSPEDIRFDGQTPFIAVFCDETDTMSDGKPPEDLNGLGSPTNAKLIIEIGVASSRELTAALPAETDDQAPMPTSPSKINATDEALEIQVGFMTRQAKEALTQADGNSPWSDLWRFMCEGGIRRIEQVRGGPAQNTMQPRTRYASRITVIHANILAGPPRGSDLSQYPFWQSFLALCAADEELAQIGKLFAIHITGAAGIIPDWREAQKILQLTTETARAIGINPIDPDPDEAPAPLKSGQTAPEPYVPPPAEVAGDPYAMNPWHRP